MLYRNVPSPFGSSDSSAGEVSLFSIKGILRESLKLLAPRFSEADSFWQGIRRRRKRGWEVDRGGGRGKEEK